MGVDSQVTSIKKREPVWDEWLTFDLPINCIPAGAVLMLVFYGNLLSAFQKKNEK